MGINYPVGIGTILLCDYSRGGFQPPEMVKKRPAAAISPRLLKGVGRRPAHSSSARLFRNGCSDSCSDPLQVSSA
jgi:hypothetical protein